MDDQLFKEVSGEPVVETGLVWLIIYPGIRIFTAAATGFPFSSAFKLHQTKKKMTLRERGGPLH